MNSRGQNTHFFELVSVIPDLRALRISFSWISVSAIQRQNGSLKRH